MKLRNILIAAAVIMLGVVFRLGSSVPVFITELVYQPPSGGIVPKAKNPASAVKRFYMLFDQGRYNEAYELVVEPDWVEDEKPAPYRKDVTASKENYYGIISKEEFLSRMTGEVGPKGIFLNLSHIKASDQDDTEISLPFSEFVEYPEYSELTAVKVRGDYLASCAIYRWEKIVPVIKTAGGYKLVLEGTKKSKENYYLNWLNFSEKKLIKSLRGTPKQGAL